eukprot:1614726-Rhodomonas_salina.1
MARGSPTRVMIKDFPGTTRFYVYEPWEPPRRDVPNSTATTFEVAHQCSSPSSKAAGEWGHGLTQTLVWTSSMCVLTHTDFLSLWYQGRVSESEDDHVRDVTTVTVAPLHISSYVSPWEIQGS